MPAAWGGVASLFLAPDRISTEGIQPPSGENDEWSIEPIARHVSDLALLAPLFQTATETKNGQPLAEIGSPTEVELSGLKVAYVTKWNHGRGIPDAEIQELVEAAARHIETIGVQLQMGIPDSLHSLGDIWFASKVNKKVCDLDKMHTDFQSYGVEKTPILVELMEWVSDWQGRCDLAEQLTTAGRLPQQQQGFEDFMQGVDAIILPVHFMGWVISVQCGLPEWCR